MPQEGKHQAGEIAAAAHASHHDVRVVLGQLHLLLRLQADDRLMQQHVVQHAAQRIADALLRDGRFHGLADGDAQAAGAVGILLQNRPAAMRFHRGAGDHVAAPDMHHHPPVRLLMVAHLDHENLALQVEHRAGERQG